ncbi:uncharacterized protein BDW47DRAFT_97233 [Aspergillus candidus]|uniref:Major facilitator superfamily domain-containing protein n=1 Tax=Aspergillus candidus TaxID=41067 RepID=A0A2I2FPA4_ASPCN|nr:hypothetical protein BDW47DRAFT_97233 [Aspergillus candidus]PLB42463.1 hypothetical protein BDW47DRAFT_97233 [Aspergillus candidus]
MDVFYAYTYSTAGWLSLQGLALTTVPQLMSTMLLDETRPATSVEVYFARCLGFSLLTVAMLTIMLTGSIPLSSTVSDPVSTEESDPKAPYAVPTLIITCAFHSVSAAYAYTRYVDSSQAVFAIGLAVYGLVAAVGLWCVLFASSNGRISRKTGADKRTAGFPFKNMEASKRHAGKKSS